MSIRHVQWKYTDNKLYTRGTQKFQELLKKIIKNIRAILELQPPFKAFPLCLDAAISELLPLLETLSKIFNGDDVKGHQRFSLNLCKIIKTHAFQIPIHPWEQKERGGAIRAQQPFCFWPKGRRFGWPCRGSARIPGGPWQHLRWRFLDTVSGSGSSTGISAFSHCVSHFEGDWSFKTVWIF